MLKALGSLSDDHNHCAFLAANSLGAAIDDALRVLLAQNAPLSSRAVIALAQTAAELPAATVVVEAGARSGSLTTANGVVPSPLVANAAALPNALIFPRSFALARSRGEEGRGDEGEL